MFEYGKIRSLDDFFTERSRRARQCVYFYRINGYNEEIKEFLQKYCEAARQTGVVIEGKIPNPERRHLEYYEEAMGMAFWMDPEFIRVSLQKWLPRMHDCQRRNVAASVYDTLEEMRQSGKNESVLKNAYIKFMCWLYYKFEQAVSRLGENAVPKILYEGDISSYELKMLRILSQAGSDVVLLQCQGDENYRKLDASSSWAVCLELAGMGPFPEGFCVKWLREEARKQRERERICGGGSQIAGCVNAWIKGEGLQDSLKSVSERGSDSRFFYNCFCRINGVEDKVTYLNELYQFQAGIKSGKRQLVILEKEIPPPTPEEIGAIGRRNYGDAEQMLADLSRYIRYTANAELERLMKKAFFDLLSEEAQDPKKSRNRILNETVYLLCWLSRYQPRLFQGWKMPEVGCFVYLGGCRNEREALFVRFLARLPVDVLILRPDRNWPCCLQDRFLHEVNYEASMAVERFPREGEGLHMGTVGYHAERELDALLYEGSGIYRDQQYARAVSVTLRTMYEEIAILWDQEVRYRPNFSVTNGQVSIPVLFAKVSGVKDAQISRYWANIRALATADALVVREAPYIRPTDPNPMKAYAAGFFKNRRLLRAQIRAHACYPYGFLREEMQEHILDKLELLIERRIIKGTFENGTEYTVIATALNLSKEIVRMLQRFDFTKKNPKLIYIHTAESMISLEDSILTAFLNLAGFDVVFFVPTGYQSIEKHFNRPIMEEHQAGAYLYDLQVPAFGEAAAGTRLTWREKLFKRGN